MSLPRRFSASWSRRWRTKWAEMRKAKANPRDPLVCLCNQVPRSVIERAIDDGACTLAQIFDATWAGCGPCGGSCQPEIVHILTERLSLATPRGRS